MSVNLNSVCIKVCVCVCVSINTHIHTPKHKDTHTPLDTLISQYTVNAHVSQPTPVTELLSCELIVIDCTVYISH